MSFVKPYKPEPWCKPADNNPRTKTHAHTHKCRLGVGECPSPDSCTQSKRSASTQWAYPFRSPPQTPDTYENGGPV